MILSFVVPGNPLCKQSFRSTRRGNFTEERIKAWQDSIGWAAKQVMVDRNLEPMTGPLNVWVEFWRADERRTDLDNLLKVLLDGIKGIVMVDDSQVIHLCAWKHVNCAKNPRLEITIQERTEGMDDGSNST